MIFGPFGFFKLTPPTRRGYASSGWGNPRPYRNGWHAGMDFPDDKGTPVLAAADGVVSYVKNWSDSFAGKWIAIDHGNGITSRYLHNNENFVTKGQRVEQGQRIGTVGTTGTTNSAPHVHFDIKLNPDAWAAYQEGYKRPSTGYPKPLNPWGVGVPVETFMTGASYKDGLLELAKSRNVSVRSTATPWLIGGAAAAVAGFLASRYIR